MTSVLSQPVPNERELAVRLDRSLLEGASLAALNAERLLGLHDSDLMLLSDRSDQEAWRREHETLAYFRNTLRLNVAGRGEAAVVFDAGIATHAKAGDVAAAVRQAIDGLGLTVLLVSAAGRPEHPVLTRATPTGWVAIACPLSVGESGERAKIGGFRLTLDPETVKPDGWRDVRDGRRVVGWVSPDGRVLRLRFHPFALSSRLTVARREQRVALLRQVLELARPYLTAGARGEVPAEQIAQWRVARARAQALVAAVQEEARIAAERLAVAEREARAAEERVEQLAARLAEATADANDAAARASHLAPAVRAQAATRAKSLAETLVQVRALPEVVDAELAGAALRVQLPRLSFELPLVPSNEQLLRIVAGGDRAASSTGEVALGDAFLPLAQALAGANHLAAVRIAVGVLAG